MTWELSWCKQVVDVRNDGVMSFIFFFKLMTVVVTKQMAIIVALVH